ncbi:hypothetical protein PFZ79_002533 [Enterococcus hirae]|nr:hypothetical protein [Enterococcus hirae]
MKGRRNYVNKKILAVSLLAFTFTGATLPSGVLADTTESNQITQELISKIDPYIFIQNNQFVLKLPDNFAINSTQLIQINQQIQKDNGKINVANKETTYPSLSQYVNEGYTSNDFWWGTRYYFRSNTAVYQMEHELDNYSIVSGIVGAIGGLASAGIGSAVGAIGAAYFQKMRSDLENYYNNTHIKDYPFFMKLRKRRGSLLLFIAIIALYLLQIKTFQPIYLPFYLLIAVGFFYFINDDT